MQVSINKETTNVERFELDVIANNPLAEFTWRQDHVWIANTVQDEAAIQLIASNHDPNVLTDEQLSTQLSALTKSEIKAYLRSQLVNASPNLATIKSTIESAIGSNAQATQAISNIASLYGYDDTTASGYVRCALLAVPILVD